METDECGAELITMKPEFRSVRVNFFFEEALGVGSRDRGSRGAYALR